MLSAHYHSGPRPGQQRAPSSGKRYKPGTYSDYMDSAEVASSIMSVPPMYRNKVVSLPRPRSSQVRSMLCECLDKASSHKMPNCSFFEHSIKASSFGGQ